MVYMLPAGTKNVVSMVYLVGFSTSYQSVYNSISNGDWYTSSCSYLVILCDYNERDMPAGITSHWTIQKHFWEDVFFVTAVAVLSFTELTCWNINNTPAALSKLFSASLYLNNSKWCTLNLRKPSSCFLIDRNYLTIDISEAGRDSTNHLPSFYLQSSSLFALNSFSKVSFFFLPASIYPFPCIKEIGSEAFTSHNTPFMAISWKLLHNPFHFTLFKTGKASITETSELRPSSFDGAIKSTGHHVLRSCEYLI